MYDKESILNKNLKLSFWISLILLSILVFVAFTRCGTQLKPHGSKKTDPQGGEENAYCLDGLKVGETKSVACEPTQTGERIYVCKEKAKESVLISNSCKGPTPPGCSKTTWEENLKPIVQTECADCHAAFLVYDNATQRIDEWIRRIDLASEDPRRMPKKPKAELSQSAKDVFLNWKRDGLVKSAADCSSTDTGSTIEIDEIETALLVDIAKVKNSDRPFIRYLITSHKANQGLTLPVGKGAVDKALNSLVEKDRNITLTSFIDAKKSILRFDLRSFELSPRDWGFIEQFDQLKLESFTDKGNALKLIIGGGVKQPWMHFDNFIDLVNTPALYYFFLNIPQYEYDLRNKIGVNFANDLAQLDATFIGNNDSLLTNQRNRLLVRLDSLDGYYWQTFDSGPLNGDPTRNLYEFPFLPETGSNRNFRFLASEVIFSLPNGLQGYALFDKFGNRLRDADINVVRDQVSPVPPAPIIRNAISCHRCHASGLNSARDEIRAHVIAHGDEFGVNNVERAKSLYKQEASLSAIFKTDNRLFGEALKKMGMQLGDKDPINVWRDELYLNWDDKKLAAFLFLPLNEFRERLNQSAEARRAIGQLLSGGSVTYDEVIRILPVIKRDFRLFLDPINGN